MGHHAPEAIATAEFQHTGGRTLGEDWRAHGAAKELKEQQGAQRLAMELVEVDRERIGVGRVREIGAAIALGDEGFSGTGAV